MPSTIWSAPAETALDIRHAVASRRRCAILESSPGFGDLGRYSIFAALPRAIFQANGAQWALTGDWPAARPPRQCNPLEALSFLKRQTACDPCGEPFAGGWIGYVGYDVAPLLEKLPRRYPNEGSLPDIHLAYYDTFAIHDLAAAEVRFVSANRFGESQSATREREKAFRDLIEQATYKGSETDDHSVPLCPDRLQSDFTPDEYCHAVERILEYIRAGDIFQANFSHRFSAEFHGEIRQLYERCRTLSPAPFGALLRHDEWSVVSTSPERFLRLTPNGDVETRPIKGTRKRGADQIHDLLLREELASSEKDLAELTMIVDLERNDLGRVCQFGSVHVRKHAQIESYSNVHHLASVVDGKLRPECGPIELLCAAFPGGSITGAPKIRAMEIIDSLERRRRGVYTGAIGYFSDDGGMDLNIAIRTLTVDEGQVHYHVGGGIVADSDPLAEYRETLEKGRRLHEAIAGRIR